MDQLLNDFSPGLFIVQTILFLGLIFLMVKFAWKPILTSLNDREEGIRNALDEADKARQEMKNINADNERILKEARAERDAMLKEAHELKNNLIEEAKEEAKAQSKKMIEQAKMSIHNEKQAAITELKNEVADLSIHIAEKVVKGELSDKAKQLKLVDQMLNDVKI